jgi:hypothetical protein
VGGEQKRQAKRFNLSFVIGHFPFVIEAGWRKGLFPRFQMTNDK